MVFGAAKKTRLLRHGDDLTGSDGSFGFRGAGLYPWDVLLGFAATFQESLGREVGLSA